MSSELDSSAKAEINSSVLLYVVGLAGLIVGVAGPPTLFSVARFMGHVEAQVDINNREIGRETERVMNRLDRLEGQMDRVEMRLERIEGLLKKTRP